MKLGKFVRRFIFNFWCNQSGPTLWLFGLVALLGAASGCHTADPAMAAATQNSGAPVVPPDTRLNSGDVVQITFPAAPTLNTQEKVRLDGRLLLPLVGQVDAAGKTSKELQADLVKLYQPHLQVAEVMVNVLSSSASVYVGGAVNKPGRIPLERPMTALEAIMEAGGFDPKRANVKKVTVVRQADGHYSQHVLNLKPVLRGQEVEPFKLEPFDTVFVPERIF